jgi:transposase-like protein
MDQKHQGVIMTASGDRAPASVFPGARLALSDAMTELECPRCRRTGLIRTEQVIRGQDVATYFHCGACRHSWMEPEATPARDSSHRAREAVGKHTRKTGREPPRRR